MKRDTSTVSIFPDSKPDMPNRPMTLFTEMIGFTRIIPTARLIGMCGIIAWERSAGRKPQEGNDG
jgi:hypothetical protein